MDSNNLYKVAAVAIKELQKENESLREELLKAKEAEKLAFDLLKTGSISLEQLESTIHDLSNKTKEDVEIIKKASELTKNGNYSPFGLSKLTGTDDPRIDNLTRFILDI